VEAIEGKQKVNCQICKEGNAKQQISRRLPARADRPFYRICWDVIPLKDGFLEHLYDDYTGFHSVEIVRSTRAADLLKLIKKAIHTYERL
jgi:hypothetical protein